MDPSSRFSHLLSRLADGLLDSAEAAELEEILLHDRAARDHYRVHASVHLALTDGVGASTGVIPLPAVRHRTWKWPALAAAAAVVLAAGSIWWSGRPADAPQQVDAAPELPVLAVASAADGVVWNLPVDPAGGCQIGPGVVRLHQGRLSLSLVGGQLVHLVAPAEFELLGDEEFALRRGPAAFRTHAGRAPFIVHLPKGALVDGGSEFSVDVADDGVSEVHVFDRALSVSTVGSSGRTLEEVHLDEGGSLMVGTRISPGNRKAKGFLRVPPVSPAVPPGSEAGYAAAVMASSPAAYWRFEVEKDARMVPDETGRHPLELIGRARISGAESQRFLVTDDGDSSGFAATLDGIGGLDTARGMTLECLLFPTDEKYGTAVAFELAGPHERPADAPESVRHAPQTFALERMSRRGEHLGHIHPDFSLRAMFRSPGGYTGGTNLYSRESHLLHRWVHVVAVKEGGVIRIHVDGELSDSASVDQAFLNATLRPIIGRLQPHPGDELRQWIGGIDEVAIYGRALTAEEIRAHATALKP